MDSFDRQWQRWFPEDRENKSETSPPRGANRGLLILAGLFVLFFVISVLKGFYTEWLWFSKLDYASVYKTILGTKVGVFFLAAISFCVLFLGNLVLATHLVPKTEARFWPWTIVRQIQSLLKIGVILGTAFLSLIFGLAAQSNWEVILRFLNQQPFNILDPVFQREVGFYVFSLPFYHLLQGWLAAALIVTLIGSAGVYLLSYGVQRLKFDFRRRVLAHIGGMVIVSLGLFAWGYWLGIWELVFSSQGVVFGASYADMNARLPAQWILIAVVVILAFVILVSIWRRNSRWPVYGLGVWIAVAILASGIYPALLQRLQVEPNELAKERPYIEHNIRFTREAFALNRIEEQQFPAEDTPTPQDIAQNDTTVNNIRLWDPRPLKNTYNQLQSFRPYYDFNDVDIDRYVIDGEYSQVMLSARELSAEKLPVEAQTWVNRKLQFTHGYGLTMSPVNEIGADGLPVLQIQDIPPSGIFDIEQPQLYFGEKTDDYVIVGTKTEELDYATGAETVYSFYQGNGGVSLSGFFRRLVYAWQFGDFNLLISNELTPESRVLYYRNIQKRVNHLAPFLKLDSDPYLVMIDGRLLWIQDAYTTSNRFPYSEPVAGGLNYIRNSVKAVIDAYHGGVTFYVTDTEDPLVQTHQAIFPGLFVPFEQMPESLRIHLRYPGDMFSLQALVYQTYHMQDARIFYNKEDLWAVPKEVFFGNQQQAMDPYYIIMRLPGEEKEEFLLMLPFTPANKDIAIGWLAARSDGENYGKLLAYLFPKGRTVLGPSQIENRIGQDTVIAEQLALWGRGGARVIRGNLLLIPIGESMLFVEPIFLEAESGGLPELKRVIVAAGEKIAMQPTLEESLAAIFGAEAPPGTPEVTLPGPTETEKPPATDIVGLINEAQRHYDNAQEYLQAGNWSGYGEELAALQAVLKQLAELATGE
ncbi:MAG: UPF0182 family protein [Dehalococcoidales bacterium]|nr:UPF0182 family protein [Dehalococcoidales bacterium]MDP7524824.1 UPF0182 family protein [Dehalococcoidales bacterium]